jgi:hypothetical protein
VIRRAATAALLLPLVGCGLQAREYSENPRFSSRLAYTTADVRVILQRELAGREITCTEPSPDVAKAISTLAQLQANGGNGTIDAGFSGAVSRQEALMALAGRSTALLGLRDGLFRACEAYANGAIGDTAYALILSRYGQLMATLFLAQDASEAGSGAAAASVANQVLSSVLSAPTTNNGNSKQGGGGSPGSEPDGGNGGNSGPKNSSAIDSKDSLLRPVAFRPGSGLASGAIEPAAAQGSGKGSGAAGQQGGAGGDNGGKAGSQAPSDAAQAIGQMQKNYLDLDRDATAMLHLLVTGCANEYDPSRPIYTGNPKAAAAPPPSNAFFGRFCLDPTALSGLAETMGKLAPQDLKPARDAPQSGRPSAGSVATPQVKALQDFLQRQGTYRGAIDGIYGPQTAAALKAYLAQKGVTVQSRMQVPSSLPAVAPAQAGPEL